MALIYEVKLEDVTERDLHYDSEFYGDILRSNTDWATSNHPIPDEARVLTDVFHGSEWRAHEHLGATHFATPTLAWQAYCDGVDVPNVVGAAAGHHHMTVFFTLCLNKQASQRSRLLSINLAAVVYTADLKHFGPATVVSGDAGEPYHSSSLGASLRRFEDGVRLKVPNMGKVDFRGWLFSFVGDAPAVAEMVGTKQSFSNTKTPCNMCENANAPALKQFSKFLACECADDRQHAPGCECKFALRTATRDAIHKEHASDACTKAIARC